MFLRIRMLPSFASHNVWARLLGMGERDESKVTVFHGVPAMYARLAADHEKMFTDSKTAEYVRVALASRMRLMCAGSAPLPESLFHKWEQVSAKQWTRRQGFLLDKIGYRVVIIAIEISNTHNATIAVEYRRKVTGRRGTNK